MSERRGPAGLDGLDGASAYEIAKAMGFAGTATEWLASLQGPPGRDGQSVPVEAVRAMVEEAFSRIERPLNGTDGHDGLNGNDGAPGERGLPGERGERGERGMEGAAAELPPLVPWRADWYRDAISRLTLRVRAGAKDGTGQFINLIPVRGDDDLIVYVDLIPEPA